MGGAGFIFTGDNDADILRNSAMINLNLLDACAHRGIRRIFYSSSACIYPAHNQLDPGNPLCRGTAPTRQHPIANMAGKNSSANASALPTPAAICRKVAEAGESGEIELWGDGAQTRSFLHVDECIEGVLRLTRSDWMGPVNIGSEEMVTINQLAHLVMGIAGKQLSIRHIPGPQGVRGRNSDNRLILQKLGWAPDQPLEEGLRRTYAWICSRLGR